MKIIMRLKDSRIFVFKTLLFNIQTKPANCLPDKYNAKNKIINRKSLELLKIIEYNAK